MCRNSWSLSSLSHQNGGKSSAWGLVLCSVPEETVLQLSLLLSREEEGLELTRVQQEPQGRGPRGCSAGSQDEA